ncbi:NACHT domain-containing protein [Romeriopsis navalis]|uniref:NACHT domain-containing protein n=1 Tax=Romeriopsis navalis TaxID=2992132 RepID=UPI0021F88B79|nr:NACHT domain-containing protein [Romeriopsis navalis]
MDWLKAIALIKTALPLLKQKLERQEWVIQLLQELELEPAHLLRDFPGVYQYSLVEYAAASQLDAYRLGLILELFHDRALIAGFRESFEKGVFERLEDVVSEAVNALIVGEQVKQAAIDYREEIFRFATIFVQLVRKTQTPGEILTSLQIEGVHESVRVIQAQLQSLPALQKQLTQLTQALPLAENDIEEVQQESQLAQQMRSWFQVLGYDLEEYHHTDEKGFEWIIRIPTRRGRFDRILVRGVDGETAVSDVKRLQVGLDEQEVDEAWVVAVRRISPAAKQEVTDDERFRCLTFDELLDDDADFSDYLDWLEGEIRQRQLAERYVPLACCKDEVDPETQAALGRSRYGEDEGWIDGYIDRWLDDPSKEHVSVLGEFGTGKTWFTLHYAWTILQRYREAKLQGKERPRLPLVIPLRDYAKAIKVDNIIAGFFFTKHNIRLNAEVFDQLNQMGKLLLIFDGFDEMAARVDRQQMINQFWELAEVVKPGAKVILTCRTEHFPEAREGRSLLNAELQASTADLKGLPAPQFEVLELEKFSDAQIRRVLGFQAEAATVEQVMGNPQLLDLARRPVMTELVIEALPEIEAGKPIDIARVYLYAVQRKMQRDIKEERTFTSMADKLYFLCELSWEMLYSDRMSLNYREFPDRLRQLFGDVVREDKTLDHWHYDMMGQSMLIRNSEGDYSPAHRSLLEFFVAYKFGGDAGGDGRGFSEYCGTDRGSGGWGAGAADVSVERVFSADSRCRR